VHLGPRPDSPGRRLFLIAKSTHEIHERLEGDEARHSTRPPASFGSVVGQLVLLDLVFSLDSVITAVGMARQLGVMIRCGRDRRRGDECSRRPPSATSSTATHDQDAALSFLLLIRMSLIADGLGQHLSKGYIYFAMGFSVFVDDALTCKLPARGSNRCGCGRRTPRLAGSIDSRGEVA